MASTAPPSPISARFTLELEFVLCLSHPGYLQHLALTYPHLLNPPTSKNSASQSNEASDSDAAKFARYLSYLYSYWRKPEYSKYLTYPGATLRNLELLQQEQFRKDLIRPDLIAMLGQMPEAMKQGELNKLADESEVQEGDMKMSPG